MTMACLAVNCRFCKYERERDGILTVPSASSSSSICDEIGSRMRETTATMDLDDGEREQDGTASLNSQPDDTFFDLNALASSLRSRRDSIHSFGNEGVKGVDTYYTEQPELLGDGIIDGNVCDDTEMGESEEDDGNPTSPTPSSVYSNGYPLMPLHSPLYTQSESGVHDDTKNISLDFLDNVLFDLDAWLDAGGLDAGGLHDDKNEEEYTEYVAWYKAVVREVARGMSERGERRRSV